MLSLCLVIQCGVRVSPLGFFLRVIVNKKNLNLKKTTYSVLSVSLLIYGEVSLNLYEMNRLMSTSQICYTATHMNNYLNF